MMLMSNKFTKYSDKELVEIIRKDTSSKKSSSEKAFGVIFNRYSTKIHTYCKCIINDSDQAEDIFQETFIRFYKSLGKNFEPINVAGFLYTTARNLCF